MPKADASSPGAQRLFLIGWREGKLSFYHFDLYAQALAKIELAHSQDLADVDAMLDRGLVERKQSLVYFQKMEPELFRFPAIDPGSFGQRVRARFG
jgi:hypothetical protein